MKAEVIAHTGVQHHIKLSKIAQRERKSKQRDKDCGFPIFEGSVGEKENSAGIQFTMFKRLIIWVFSCFQAMKSKVNCLTFEFLGQLSFKKEKKTASETHQISL